MAAFAKNRSFDLRLSNPIFDNKKGRKRKEFEIIPNSICTLIPEWSKWVQTANRSKLLCNIPVEYLALFSHADSDSVITLTGKNIVSNQNIEFRPTYFESNESKEFKLVDLFTVQMTTENRISTQFRAFSNNWYAMINSLPWRHNEVMSLLCIYNFIEAQFYSEGIFKVTLEELVRECAKKTIKKEYIRALYSLLVLQDTDIFIVNSKEDIIISKKKLFTIKSNNELIQSLSQELKKIENDNASELLKILSQFEINFNTGALGDIENLHKHETGKLPLNFTPQKGGKKPNYWKPRIYKGGHLFHTLHPHLNVSPVIIRAWALLNAFQPNLTCGFKDIVKGFSIETFSSICGLSNIIGHKQFKFNEYLNELAKYWGTFETKDNNLYIKYGYDKKISISLREENDIKVFDIQYGIIQNSPTEDSQIRNNLIKDVSINQLKQALLKHKLNEEEASSLAEQIKLKEFSATKSTGKAILMPSFNSIQTTTDEVISKKLEPESNISKNHKKYNFYENKIDANNDLAKNALIARIEFLKGKTIAGNNGDELRKTFLKALEGGINQSVISMKLEQIERFIQ